MANLPPTNRILTGAGVIAVSAALLALVANQGFARLLVLPDGAEVNAIAAPAGDADAASDQPVASNRPKTRRPPSKSSLVDPIIKRNMFDPDAIGVTTGGSDEVDGQKTDLDIVLLATVVADYDDDPEVTCQKSDYSSALIADGKDKNARATGYGIGSDLMGEGEVICIDKKLIWIRRSNGNTEYLAIDETERRQRQTSSTRSSRSRNDNDDDRIQEEGDGRFSVDRSLIDEQLENVEKLATQIRVVPHKGPDGEIDGYRLSAIRRGSLFDQLGIKNGDIVHGVNGMPLTSADGAMSAYQALMNESSFTFDLTRRNQKKTFEYEIR